MNAGAEGKSVDKVNLKFGMEVRNVAEGLFSVGGRGCRGGSGSGYPFV